MTKEAPKFEILHKSVWSDKTKELIDKLNEQQRDKFLLWLLTDETHGVKKFAKSTHLSSIETVILLFTRKLAGEKISDAEWKDAVYGVSYADGDVNAVDPVFTDFYTDADAYAAYTAKFAACIAAGDHAYGVEYPASYAAQSAAYYAPPAPFYDAAAHLARFNGAFLAQLRKLLELLSEGEV